MKARSIGRNGPQTTTTRLSIPFYLPKKRRKTPSRFPFYSDSYPHHCCGFPIFSPLGLLILFRPRSFCHLIISLIYLGPFLLLLASFIMLISAHSIGSSVCLSFSFPFFFFFFCSRVTSSSGMVCRVEWSYFANFIFSPPSPLSITLHHPISYHFHQLATSSACLSVFFFFFFLFPFWFHRTNTRIKWHGGLLYLSQQHRVLTDPFQHLLLTPSRLLASCFLPLSPSSFLQLRLRLLLFCSCLLF